MARDNLSGTPLPTAWPPSYVLLAIPLAIAVARDPGPSLVPLSGALPAAVVVVIAALLLVPGDGFWWWFGAASAGAMVAAVVFGLLRRISRAA